jgi:hypothetical protein
MTLTLLAALAWTAVVADGLLHIAVGDVLVPAAMALAGVGYVAIRLVVIRTHPVREVERSN